MIAAATRSRPEWAASERIPRLPVEIPTTIFKLVIATAAKTEFRATDSLLCAASESVIQVLGHARCRTRPLRMLPASL